MKTIFVIVTILLIGCSSDEETATEIVVPQDITTTITTKTQEDPSKVIEKEVAPSGSCSSELDKYEDFVDEYVAYLTKVHNRDFAAMSKINSLMQKAQEAQAPLQKMVQDGKLDGDCYKKYLKINHKMNEAAMEMSGASSQDKAELKKIEKAQEKAVDQLTCIQKCQSKSDPMAQMTCLQNCQ